MKGIKVTQIERQLIIATMTKVKNSLGGNKGRRQENEDRAVEII
jgi:hypothetical protein